jgi:hypothetical protein
LHQYNIFSILDYVGNLLDTGCMINVGWLPIGDAFRKLEPGNADIIRSVG